MGPAIRAIGRLLLCYFAFFVAAIAVLGGIWLVAYHVIPFFFGGTTSHVVSTVGEETARLGLLAVATAIMVWAIVSIGFAYWRRLYLGPSIGKEYAEALELSRFEKLVRLVATVEGLAILVFVPGAFATFVEVGNWLPEASTPGVVGTAAIFTLVVGTTIYLADLMDFSWRSRPGHDLGWRHS